MKISQPPPTLDSQTTPPLEQRYNWASMGEHAYSYLYKPSGVNSASFHIQPARAAYAYIYCGALYHPSWCRASRQASVERQPIYLQNIATVTQRALKSPHLATTEACEIGFRFFACAPGLKLKGPRSAWRTPGSSSTCTTSAAPSDLRSTPLHIRRRSSSLAARLERLVHPCRQPASHLVHVSIREAILLLLLHCCPDLVPWCVLQQQPLLPLRLVHGHAEAGRDRPLVRSVLMLPEGALN
jgi:hypothetical protein